MPGFPAWLGKYSAQNKRARLTKEIVHHTALSVGQVGVYCRCYCCCGGAVVSRGGCCFASIYNSKCCRCRSGLL
jgi:hypothetical protein